MEDKEERNLSKIQLGMLSLGGQHSIFKMATLAQQHSKAVQDPTEHDKGATPRTKIYKDQGKSADIY